jgi:hypothetical protein
MLFRNNPNLEIKMTMKNILLIAILMIFSLAGASAVFAQNDMLASGNPPLTETDFAAVIEFYERGLAMRFSDAERDELRGKFVETWRKSQKSRAAELGAFMSTVRKINAIDGEKIRANQQEFKDALLGDLQKMSNNGWASFVLEVYENAEYRTDENAARTNDVKSEETEPATADAPTSDREPVFQPLTGAVRAADLTGKWVKGSIASYGYQNTVTNDYRSGYGAANQHDVYANGVFDYTNYAQISSYGCTTELYTSMKGRYSLRGGEITFSYVSGTVKIEDGCKKSVVTRAAQIKAATYRLEQAGGQLRMCEVGAENPTCLYKTKE